MQNTSKVMQARRGEDQTDLLTHGQPDTETLIDCKGRCLHCSVKMARVPSKGCVCMQSPVHRGRRGAGGREEAPPPALGHSACPGTCARDVCPGRGPW